MVHKNPENIPLTSEELKAAKENMEASLALRSKDGLIHPILPVGDGEVLRLMGPVLAPVWEPNSDGLVEPIIFCKDFADGRIPPNLSYQPGHLATDSRTGDAKVFFDDPTYNLSLQERLRLQAPPPPPPPPADSQDIPSPCPVRATPQGMVFQTSEGASSLSNFNVRAVARRIIKQRGVLDSEEFELEIECRGECRRMTVSSSELENIVPKITRAFPACHTDADASKASLRIANTVRDQIPTLSTLIVVKTPGFIRLGNQWVYAHDGTHRVNGVEFRTGYTIPCDPKISPQKALHALLDVLELSDNSPTMLPLMLESCLGPLYNLFDAAGFAPKFIVFLHGQTGSLKTAVVQALFRLFKELPEHPESTFRDTPTALEVKVGHAYSRVAVIDDYQPAVTSSAGRENLVKLEFVIRLYGDGIAKSRSNSELGRAREFPPAGCCVVTGEDTGGSHSSLLRCLVLPIQKGEISGERLKLYQDHPEYLHTHFFHFLQWAGENGDKIIDFIQREFQTERARFSQVVSEPRQVDIGATLMLTARILLAYMRDTMSLDDVRIANFNQRWINTLAKALRRSEEQSTELDPVAMYLKGLFFLIDTGKLLIAPSQAEFKRGCHVGFEKGGSWWLHPSEVYAKVVRFWQEQKVVFPLKSGKLHALLAEAQLIDTTQENRRQGPKILYLLKSTLEGRPRMLVLHAEQAHEYVEKAE